MCVGVCSIIGDRIQLVISCTHSLCVFYIQVGRTENIKNCLSPQFVRTMDLDYYFEEVQQLSFAVYDIDNTSPKLSDDDFLGQMNCTLGQVGESFF